MFVEELGDEGVTSYFEGSELLKSPGVEVGGAGQTDHQYFPMRAGGVLVGLTGRRRYVHLDYDGQRNNRDIGRCRT